MKTNINNSEGLNKSFEKNTNLDIKNKLSDLQALGIDPELFAQFEKRVNDILSQNPGTEAIISSELEKTKIAFEGFNEYSKTRIRGIITNFGDNNLEEA